MRERERERERDREREREREREGTQYSCFKVILRVYGKAPCFGDLTGAWFVVRSGQSVYCAHSEQAVVAHACHGHRIRLFCPGQEKKGGRKEGGGTCWFVVY